MSVKIILADDYDSIRHAQRRLLETEPDFEIAGEARNGREVIQLATQCRPDIVIMDINMPEVDGIEATRRLCQSDPDVKVIGFSSHTAEPIILEMLNAGASGYVSKICRANELVKAIRTVLKGEIYISPSIHGIRINGMHNIDKKKDSKRLAKLAAG